MSVILKRTLTLKSKIGFGKYKEYTVNHLIGMNKNIDLLSMYYKLGKIDFNQEIKDLIGISTQFEIEKPSKDLDMYYAILNHLGYEKKIIKRRRSIKSRKERGFNSGLGMLPKTNSYSKVNLQSKNHGK